MLLAALTLVLGVPAAAQAQVAVSDAVAAESADSITFTITRQAGVLAPAATVSFATADGSASAGEDYIATSGSRTLPFSLLGGAQSAQVRVAIAADALDEPDETLRLNVSGTGVTDGEGVGTIVDDDGAPAISIADAAAAAEGSTAQFTIALSTPSGRGVSVGYATADGSAVAGDDFSARSGRVTIAAGASSATVGVPLLDDALDEPSESFMLNLSAPSEASLADASATATIVDNDEPAAAPPAPPSPSAGAGGPSPPTTGSSANGTLPRLGVSSPRLRQPATIVVTVACPRQPGRCSGRMTIFSRPNRRSKIKALRVERRLGRRNFNLPGGGTQTLRIALSRRDRVLLRRAGRINVRAYVVTTDGAGRSGVRRVNGVLVARTRHSGG